MLDSDANLESHEMPALSSHAASQLSSLFSEALSSLSSASSCSGSTLPAVVTNTTNDDTPLPAAKLRSEEQPSIPPIAEGFRLIIISDYAALLLYYLSIPTVNEDISTK
ncbi:hypothetical protein BC826DRAFT_1109631 [Russula brevipes]|nr:hypothetical protein BC826DRAFT_1109631 [Russula brevipes]